MTNDEETSAKYFNILDGRLHGKEYKYIFLLEKHITLCDKPHFWKQHFFYQRVTLDSKYKFYENLLIPTGT